MYLVLIRHGKTEYNIEKRFCGWTDIDLSQEGIKEAENCGQLLCNAKINFDIIYTSQLKRAQETLNYILKYIPYNGQIVCDWRLNERHYGALQGILHSEAEKKYGKEQVAIWRRSFDVQPPALTEDDLRNPAFEEKYKGLKNEEIPLTESLKDTLKRVKIIYNQKIKEDLKQEKNVLIVAHGNTLRALVKDLENISDSNIASLEIPTGIPIVYKLDKELKILTKYTLC